MRRGFLIFALLFSAAVVQAAKGELPGVELRERTLFVSSLPAVLARPEVKPHLSTGLTTTLILEVNVADAAGNRARGGGKVDIRYEPWDGVFLVSALGIDGRVRKESLPSFERLLAWWQNLGLPVVAVDTLGPGPNGGKGPWQVRVRVNVIPFSQSEQREAQRWLSESIGRSEKSEADATPGSAPTAARAKPTNGALDLLLATSIKRRSLVGYDWNVVFQPERRR
jgi:hypothetical protein